MLQCIIVHLAKDNTTHSDAAEDTALYDIPAAANEMPPPQAVHGEPRGPGGRGIQGVPLLATTGNDMSSKESVDMPMEAMTHPLVEKVSLLCAHLPSGSPFARGQQAVAHRKMLPWYAQDCRS